MEAHKLKNIDDLMEALKTDDRLELINGESQTSYGQI